MIDISLEDLDSNEEYDQQDLSLDLNELLLLLSNFNSEKLCQMIVCNRYFNNNQDLDIACMEELSKRRQFGNTFDFESYIEKETALMPILDLSIPDLRSVLGEVVKNRK